MNNKNLVIYDDLCVVCSGLINFVVKRDKDDKYRFAPIGKKIHQEILNKMDEQHKHIDSVILVTNYGTQDESILLQSEAIIFLMNDLTFFGKILMYTRFVPLSIRDFFYHAFSQVRYKFFGKKTECDLIPPTIKYKFLEV